MKKSQRLFVINRLNKTGKISRNFCLSKYISRLSDIIFRLRRKGWKIEGKFVEKNGGRDYVYKVIKNV